MPRKDMRTAFVMNMDANGLGVARVLGRQGIPVVGLDFRPMAPGLFSRYVRPLVCADVMKEPKTVLSLLEREGQALKDRGVLIPTSDASVLFVSRFRKELAENFDFIIAPEHIVEGIVNKKLQYQEAARLGIPIPRTIYPRSMEEVEQGKDQMQYPAFIKPLYSHIWYKEFGNKGFIVHDQRELLERMARVLPTDLEVMVQSIIWPPGQDIYVVAAYFGRDGFVSPPFCCRKIRQHPPNFGVGCMVQSVHKPEAVELAMRFMKGIHFQGIGAVGIKLDSRDGVFKLIELNARTWMQNELSARAGLPLVLMEYQDLIGRSLEVPDDHLDGLRWWDCVSDADSFWRLRRRGQSTATSWIRSWFGSEVYAYFALDDLRPGLRSIGYGLEIARAGQNMLKSKVDEDLV